MTFKEYYSGLANINHTSTKSNSFKYSPKDESDTRGNTLANTESEEIKIKRKKKIKKFTPYKGKFGMFTKDNTPLGVKSLKTPAI